MLSNTKQFMQIRPPEATDGSALHRLVDSCPPLDGNSIYCNLLQCLHFGQSSAVVGSEGQLVAALTAYVPPQQPDTLFVWQVAVAESARGKGVAQQMLEHILRRPELDAVRFIDTTITADNAASWRLFSKFADYLGTSHCKRLLFDKETHFSGRHDSEWLMRIGPFDMAAVEPSVTNSDQFGA